MTVGAIGVRKRDSVISSTMHLVDVGQEPSAREHSFHVPLRDKWSGVYRLLTEGQRLDELFWINLLSGVKSGLNISQDLTELEQC